MKTYLANYVYKTAITSNRIICCENGKVTFRYKESKTERIKYLKIPALEFIRRFLQHTLPSGFQKIRYYGFLSSVSKNKWGKVAGYFDLKKEEVDISEKPVYFRKEMLCKHCHSLMVQHASIVRKPRAPPDTIMLTINQRILKQIKR